MRTDLDHLPLAKQRELGRIVEILFEEFDAAVRPATAAREKAGRILKIILFGSYARGTWVEDQASGYLSDYDVLVIVDRAKLTDEATYWYKAEDRFNRPGGIKRPVNLIVHTRDEVNDALEQGQYFFTDLVRDGIALYELEGYSFADPKALSAAQAYDIAKGYFEKLYAELGPGLRVFRFEMAHELEGNPWLNRAAFTLHQVTERAYGCLLLTLTLYLPQTHNIKRLRGLARQIDPRLETVWPNDSRLARRRFQLLKRAYVEARYSPHYKITVADLEWLASCVEKLRELVEDVCKERLEKLKKAVRVAERR